LFTEVFLRCDVLFTLQQLFFVLPLLDPFVLHLSIISFTSLLLHPIFESYLNRIKAVDIPYH